jgi:DNA-binding transcriptional LysR family regulator
MAKILDWDSHIGRRLRLRDLHVFFTVVQFGSLAKAAAHLRVTQPAVSQIIGDLEHAVGAKLFDRSSRGVSPTIYGQALLTRGRAAFDELREGIKDIEFLSDPEAGEVRIGCQEAIAAILPPAIESFCRLHPGVVLDIFDEEFDRYAGKLRERSIDFILQRLRGQPRVGDPFFDDLDIEVLFDDELVVVAGADSPWARRRKIDLADIVDESWILATPESWNHAVLAEAFQMRGLPMPKARLRTFSTHLRCNLVASGQFIATFPRSVDKILRTAFLVKSLAGAIANPAVAGCYLDAQGSHLESAGTEIHRAFALNCGADVCLTCRHTRLVRSGLSAGMLRKLIICTAACRRVAMV